MPARRAERVERKELEADAARLEAEASEATT
jgi:hypothetical protein